MNEEAFLLASLKEVVNIWSRGTGHANFNLTIQDGVADLKLRFQLGRPTDPHVLNQQCYQVQPQPHHADVPCEHGWQHQRRRHKTAKQRERDRERAAKHQASCQSAATAVPAVVLPFSGNLLPVKSTVSTPTVPTSTAVSVTVTPQSSSSSTEVLCRPQKQQYFDVNDMKKQIFPCHKQLFEAAAPSQATAVASSPAKTADVKNYEMREEQLWTRLFKT